MTAGPPALPPLKPEALRALREAWRASLARLGPNLEGLAAAGLVYTRQVPGWTYRPSADQVEAAPGWNAPAWKRNA